jgi:AAA15 family ATPase/GTPase
MSDTPQQAYISKVHLKGYKSIRDLEIDFKPGLNIIIGPNGSGKTNFLEFLSQYSYTEFQERYNYWVIVDIKYLENSNKFTFKSEVLNDFSNKKSNIKEIVYYYFNDEIVYITENTQISQNKFISKDVFRKEDVLDTILPELWWIGKIIAYGNPINEIMRGGLEFNVHQYYSFLNLTNLSITTMQEIIFDGIFEHILEFNIENKTIEIKREFIEKLKTFTPIKNLEIQKEKVFIEEKEGKDNINVSNIYFNFLIENKVLSWQQLSDGTKRMFYIVAAFFRIADTIFLEEPELGIHPDQLHKLMDFLKEQSKEKQIIITTHSPEVLNILSPDELDRIIVTRHDAEKGTIMRKLTEKQAKDMGERIKGGDMFLSERWVHMNLEDDIYNAQNDENH